MSTTETTCKACHQAPAIDTADEISGQWQPGTPLCGTCYSNQLEDN